MVCFKVEVGIIMTGLGYGLEPTYVRRTDILLVCLIHSDKSKTMLNAFVLLLCVVFHL